MRKTGFVYKDIQLAKQPSKQRYLLSQLIRPSKICKQLIVEILLKKSILCYRSIKLMARTFIVSQFSSLASSKLPRLLRRVFNTLLKLNG